MHQRYGRQQRKPLFKFSRRIAALSSQNGFTLIELVITLTVLTIMTLGVIPIVKTSVRRQREQRLRESLRDMREAIKEFHRDTNGMQCGGGGGGGGAGSIAPIQPPQVGQQVGQQIGPQAGQPQMGQQQFLDPRSKVVISDCTVFGVDNPDRYPPDLETLVSGVNVTPRGGQAGQTGGLGLSSSNSNRTATSTTATGDSQLALKKKVYLRAVPVDPITGKAEWELRSSYDAADAASWGKENVFDVRSTSQETALNGEKYSEW